MNPIVVDASVAWKWFDPREEFADQAGAIFDTNDEIVVPDLIGPELLNIVWKRVRRGELPSKTVTMMLATIDLPLLRFERTTPLLPHAWDAARLLDHSVYDCVYLVLAMARDCRLVTADRKFYDAVAASALADHIHWIADELQ